MQCIATLAGAGGQKISLWCGDMTQCKVDAIVNAANDRLSHGGGLAGAIVKAGGIGIQVESDLIGRCPTGKAVLTGAGWLPCRWVIHAVGPIARTSGFSTPQEDQELVNATWEALNLAHRIGCRSVAIPPISSGIFGFPKRRCAEIILYTIQQFCQQFPQSGLTDIRVLTNSQDTLDVCYQVFTLPPEALPVPGQQAPTQPGQRARDARWQQGPKPTGKAPQGAAVEELAWEEEPFLGDWADDPGEDGVPPHVDQMLTELPPGVVNQISDAVSAHIDVGGSRRDVAVLQGAVLQATNQGQFTLDQAVDFVEFLLATCPRTKGK